MKLIPRWRKLWFRLWSVKLSIIAAFLSAVEVAVSVLLDNRPPIFAIFAIMVSLGAGTARIVAQPKLDKYDGTD